jgi:two-component system, cell cycle sensor histidine kinase and response regulator CckA
MAETRLMRHEDPAMDRGGATGRFLLYALAAALAVLGAVLLVDAIALSNSPVMEQKLLLLTPGLAIAASLLAAGTAEIGRRREAAAAEARFRGFLESLPEAVVVTAPRGEVVFVNRHTERLLGHSVSDFVGNPLDNFLRAPPRPPESNSGEESIGRPRTIGDRQFLARCRDGNELVVEVSCSTLSVRGQSLLITILRDTTARWKSDCRRAARRGASLVLAESPSLDEAAPRLLRAICESFGWDLGVLWFASTPGGVLSRAGLWQRSGVEDSTFASLGCGGINAPPVPLLQRALIEGEPARSTPAGGGTSTRPGPGAMAFPVRLGTEASGILAFYARAAEPSDEGQLTTIGTISAQLTQFIRRVQAEEAVRSSEARLAAILEAALDAIVTIDPAGRVVDFNPAAETLFGHQAARVRGREFADLLLPRNSREAFRRDLEAAAKGPAPLRRELTAVRADGSDVAVEIGLTAIRHGESPLVTAYVRDLTERKRTEARLHQTEEQFRQSQKMEAVGQLAGGVAHDFNNLLTVITGHTDLLLGDEAISSRVRDSLEQMRDASRRAATLTRQLLAFSRKQVLVPAVLDLRAIVSDMGRMLRRLIGDHIELLVSVAPDLWPVRADQGQIEQALLNLAVNARDAMPRGGTLTITAANREAGSRPAGEGPAGRAVALAVHDSGSGIDPSVRDRIFEPFFTTKPRGQGTGLGLAMVYGIVKQSGGSISVESTPGAGATFTLFLPAGDRLSAVTPAPPRAPSARAGPYTVLLVEDDDMVRAVTRGMLTVKGCRVLEARNGRDALQVWQESSASVQLLVTDVVMPGLNGRELAEHLQRQQPDLKVLFVSGQTEGLFLDQSHLPRGTAFLAKPFAPDVLNAAVEGLLATNGR